jgi:hypothetical protein
MSETTAISYLPQEVSDLDLAFPTRHEELLPKWEDIPENFRNMNDRSKWAQLVSDWFYYGLSKLEGKTKEGIDSTMAIRHIKAILGDWGPKHEHKMAGCAYLLSLWFEEITWISAKGPDM